VVTSLGAAALRDVAIALERRVPHVPVTVFPAAVQGGQAPAELCQALEAAYRVFAATGAPQVLLLVRGGGSLEDLWAFNDEQLARTLARAPMPVVSGVGHETDFTIADFVDDLRAPTPTAAAELCATDRNSLLGVLAALEQRAGTATLRHIDTQAQRLDRLAQRMARPSDRVARQQQTLLVYAHRLERGLLDNWKLQNQCIKAIEADLPLKMDRYLARHTQQLDRHEAVLTSMDPKLVLNRGYAWLTTEAGHPVISASQAHRGQALTATLADGEVDLTVR
jgi:exodeoxyribonuclease VII large subunit